MLSYDDVIPSGANLWTYVLTHITYDHRDSNIASLRPHLGTEGISNNLRPWFPCLKNGI